ncbi:MAG: peptidylprolyl isomerase [Candidatus Nomurabacteria bacterium]|nr:MAG: peptidylprolyl isomerase [Candidatus Nomurabacteria bacterium]
MKKPQLNNLYVKVIGGVLGLFVLLLIVVGLGLYVFDWKVNVVTNVAKTLRYPIVFANSQPISYTAMLEDKATLSHYYKAQSDLSPDLFPEPSDEELTAIVLNKLLSDAMTNQIAHDQGVKVSNADVESEYQSVVSQSGNVETVEQNIRDLYNWDVATFKEKVIRPFLVRSAIQEKLANNNDENAQKRELADAVLARVKNGNEDFGEVAKQFSEDESTASNGGELGFFGQGEMVQPFEDAVSQLEPGEVSDIVETSFGYHIIQLEEKATDDDGNPTYRARHILIRTKSVDDLIDERLKDASVWLLAKGFVWSKDDVQVLPESAL